MSEPSAVIIPFGKHQGSTVAELLVKDPDYSQWLLSQAWLADRFAAIHAALAARGASSDDSPEHNALQVRFLDRGFREAFIRTVCPADVKAMTNDVWERWDANYGLMGLIAAEDELKANQWLLADRIPTLKAKIMRLRRTCGEPPGKIEIASYVAFEQQGLDVVVRWQMEMVGFNYCESANYISHERPPTPAERREGVWSVPFYGIRIELKPTLSDDFPSVMRAMQRLEARVLVVGNYTGMTVSEDQLRQMFAANWCSLIFVQDIEAKMAEIQKGEI